jgi:hypothetical protein
MMLGRLSSKPLEATSDVSDDDDDDDDDDEEEVEEDDNENDVGEGDSYSNQSSLTNRFVNPLIII